MVACIFSRLFQGPLWRLSCLVGPTVALVLSLGFRPVTSSLLFSYLLIFADGCGLLIALIHDSHMAQINGLRAPGGWCPSYSTTPLTADLPTGSMRGQHPSAPAKRPRIVCAPQRAQHSQ